MKVSANLNFVTVQGGRDEIDVVGLVEVCPDVVYVGYCTTANTFILEIEDGRTTIMRLGPDSYTMTLEENRPHLLRMNNMAVDVITQKLRFKQSKSRLELYAEYSLGNDPTLTKLFIKAKLNDDAE